MVVNLFEEPLSKTAKKIMTDIDPDLKYCPVCNDEYRAEFVLCAGCEIELMTGRQYIEMTGAGIQERESRSMDLSTDDELIQLRSGPLNEVKQLRSLLEKEHIPSLLVSKDGNCGKGCCGPSFLLHVRFEDGQAAMAILADEFRRTTSLMSHDLSTTDSVFDPDAETTFCPACGCSFSPTVMTCPDCGLCFG